MTVQAMIFCAAIGLIGFAYAGYPVLVWVLARLLGKAPVASHPAPNAVSVVMAAYNEAPRIQSRLVELRKLIAPLAPSSEIILVSDGSTDGTDRLAREMADDQLLVIQQPSNMGKAMALNMGVAAARNSIVVFCDTRQRWTAQTIPQLLSNFAASEVGAVSGDLVLKREDGSLAGVGLYWKLEKWIRQSESRLRSSVQVAGAICAVRRELYRPLPPGTILDDVCWPLHVSMQGYRVIHDPKAEAFDHLPDNPRDEMRRKVRTLAGNLQLLALRPRILLPWCNPVWYAVICHKLLRLVVPWAMIVALIASAIPAESWLRWMLLAQVAGYLAGIASLMFRPVARLPLMNAISSLLVLNAAAFSAWFVYFSGGANRSWKKVTYQSPLAAAPAGS